MLTIMLFMLMHMPLPKGGAVPTPPQPPAQQCTSLRCRIDS